MLRTQLIEVTPPLAEKWLADHNEGNRPISKSVVKRYADDIKNGRWMLTHQGPAFDDSDRLIDGQHRLSAVIESGIPVPMYVTFGADPETFAVIDINYKRQPGHLVPGPYAKAKAAAARFLTAPPRLVYVANFHNRDAVRIATENMPYIEDAAALAYLVYKTAKINTAMHTAVLTLALQSERVASRVPEWVEGLATGVGLDRTDPRLALRNRWALESHHLNAGGGRAESAYLIVRAWNAFVDGEPMTRLQLPKGGRGAATKAGLEVSR